MKLKIEYRPLETLLPYARNARTHSEAQVAQIAASIVEFGWTNPILVDGKNGVIAGHGRILAARNLGLKDVPVIELAHLSEIQKRAYILADNKLALAAGWDEELLALELAELKDADFNLALTGFEGEELDRLLADADTAQLSEEDEDDIIPEEPTVPVSRPGDIWRVGRHRLACGDSTSLEATLRLMAGERAALLFTSPPYDQQREYTTGIGDWDTLMAGVFACAKDVMQDNGQILVNLGLVHKDKEVRPYWDGWIASMKRTGWHWFGWYVWHQGSGLPGDWVGRFAPCFEFIFHFNKISRKPHKIVPCSSAGKAHHGCGMRRKNGEVEKWSQPGSITPDFKIPDAVVSITRHLGGIGDGLNHPAVFPVALPEFIMNAYSDENDVVFEPFCGSGSTLLAGERCNRRVFGLEVAPAYVDVALKRFQNHHPDITILLEQTGQTFADVANERENHA